MRIWPPIVWPLMSVGSLLLLMGGTGDGRPEFLIAGGILAGLVLLLSIYLATRGQSDRPWSRGMHAAMAGTALLYVAVAIAAGAAGPEYALAGLVAGVIPLSAIALMVATVRSKTAADRSGLRDASAGAHDDPYPGLGVDQNTPVGNTPERSDVVDQPDYSR
jgi:hypothetical protein